ncbi:MAG: alpha/beta hydrolase [Legionella sp.]|uniref:alpha/beta hydrolase n=1 Tax=Legionella sp. TaxID=459 RepID=UPI0039E34979
MKLPYWAAYNNLHGAVILINGAPQAQWSTLLAHLAKQLATRGWSSVLVNCTEQDKADPWIKSLPEVINTLRQQKNNKIIVVHYGQGLKQTFGSFNKSTKAGIEGLILLSAYDDPKTDDKKPELSMPLMDLAGQFDYVSVIDQFEVRKKEFAQNKYLGIRVPGAYHDYEYGRQFVLAYITGWMMQLTEFKPEPPPISYIFSIEPLMPKQVAYDDESDWQGLVDDAQAQPTQEINSFE